VTRWCKAGRFCALQKAVGSNKLPDDWCKAFRGFGGLGGSSVSNCRGPTTHKCFSRKAFMEIVSDGVSFLWVALLRQLSKQEPRRWNERHSLHLRSPEFGQDCAPNAFNAWIIFPLLARRACPLRIRLLQFPVVAG
jgi:hypothetical protein